MRHYSVTSRKNSGTATVVRRATLRREDLSSWLSTTFSSIYAALADNGRHPSGSPFARYHRVAVDQFEVEAGFPVTGLLDGSSELENSALPGEWVATTTYSGRLEDIDDAYRAIVSWIEENSAERSGDPWEVYLSDPQMRTDPAGWRTEINQPFEGTGIHRRGFLGDTRRNVVKNEVSGHAAGAPHEWPDDRRIARSARS
jgi:effector-binding domain-containing protein